MCQVKNRLFLSIGLSLAFLCAATVAYGSGYGIFVHGASALGQADAVVAHSDGPSSIFFNPALITDLPGIQAELGTTLVYPMREFESEATSQTEETVNNVYFPTTLYLTGSVSDKISLGLGVFNPFGLGNQWPDDWEGRYIATDSTLTTFNFNPVAAYQVTPRFSIAAGIDFIYLDAELSRKLLVNPALPDMSQKLAGDGTGIGYNFGILVKATDRIAIGAHYRSQVEVDVKADVTFEIPSGLSLGFPGIEAIFPNTGAETEITLPQQIYAGISAQVTDELMMEVGLRWEDWSSYEELRITLDTPISIPPQSVEVVERDWHDTFAFMVGAKYRVNKTFTLLGGYLYGKDAVPDRTFEPAIPDSDTHLFTIGSDIEFNSLKLALSYGYQLQADRDKKTNVYGSLANGTYKGQLHLAAVSLTYRF